MASHVDNTLIQEISNGRSAQTLSDPELVSVIVELNTAYRAGNPIISDHRYDHEFIAELAKRHPEHPLLHQVEEEPEAVFGEARVKHPVPMLSTEKAYTREEVANFLRRVREAAEEIGMDGSPELRATVKLDGQAGRLEGGMLVTRGDGYYGYDVSRALQRGFQVIGDGSGLGELVVLHKYFEDNLSEDFEHPRNFVVGASSADTLSDKTAEALAAGAARFVMYDALPCWCGTGDQFLEDMENIIAQLKGETAEYKHDGIILEATDPDLRRHMGHTTHHYRYMLAIKEKSDTAEVMVKHVEWQTGRTGRVSPVIVIEPTWLSGATISNVTAHHAEIVRNSKIGPGAVIEISRAGDVIPKLERVVTPADIVEIAVACPSCSSRLEWDGDKFLVCPNRDGCSAQVENTLRHFFATLGIVDLFGPATIAKLRAAGHDSLEKIYALNENDFRQAGFGPGQSANLVRELVRSRTESVEDWRFLAAFGIRFLGRGDSRQLLKHIPLRSLGNVLAKDIGGIHGFGELTSEAIAHSLHDRWPTIWHLLSLGFNIAETSRAAAGNAASPVNGKKIVFTGTMASGDREEMQQRAASLGAVIQSGVNGKTDFLVVGTSPGASKMNKAQSLGIPCITEVEYLALIGNIPAA
jgi:DNA ligase (NAD+)